MSSQADWSLNQFFRLPKPPQLVLESDDVPFAFTAARNVKPRAANPRISRSCFLPHASGIHATGIGQAEPRLYRPSAERRSSGGDVPNREVRPREFPNQDTLRQRVRRRSVGAGKHWPRSWKLSAPPGACGPGRLRARVRAALRSGDAICERWLELVLDVALSRRQREHRGRTRTMALLAGGLTTGSVPRGGDP